jgi:hypothetical protein
MLMLERRLLLREDDLEKPPRGRREKCTAEIARKTRRYVWRSCRVIKWGGD